MGEAQMLTHIAQYRIPDSSSSMSRPSTRLPKVAGPRAAAISRRYVLHRPIINGRWKANRAVLHQTRTPTRAVATAFVRSIAIIMGALSALSSSHDLRSTTRSKESPPMRPRMRILAGDRGRVCTCLMCRACRR